MGIVSVGTLVLCLIVKPTTTPVDETKTQIIEKTPGIVKEVFKKKVIRDLKNSRLAVHEDKDMLVVETLDGEAQITIGADACKRIVEPKEYDDIINPKTKVSGDKEKVQKMEVKSESDEDKQKNDKSSILNQLDK